VIVDFLARLGRRWRPVSVLLLAAVCAAQSAQPERLQTPAEADGAFLASQGARPRFEFANKVSDATMLALRQQRIASVPNFSNSFAFEGKTFPYTVVGSKPQAGGTTQIPTQLIPISLFLEGYADEDGGAVVLDPSPIVGRVRNSPNFRPAPYQTGNTQFADAVQRAQFFGTMAQDWHTLLASPQVLKRLNVVVPRGQARVYRNPDTGVVFAVVDSAFFISHLNTIVQMADLHPDALAILLTNNVLLAPEADLKRCCVLGFHTAFDAGERDNKQLVQTMLWASWTDQGVLGTNLGDVTALSHEIGEWMNDPFGGNFVPSWQHPVAGLGCQSTLETADPVAALPNSTVPVPLEGFTYHPQTQVLLPWFTRQQSDAFDGAYSFPDTRLVTGPSQPCTTR
jgi:chitinase